jgi:hypothetical protein
LNKLLSPYSYLGLTRNPFGELTREQRGELAVVDTAPLLAFLNCPSNAVQIIGDCGFGKTTHLLALRRELPSAKLIYFPETGPRPRLPSDRPLLVDEAQRMGWLRRRQLLKSAGPLAIATHIDLTRELSRSGFQVLTLDVEQPKSPRSLADILNRRIAASRLHVAGASKEDALAGGLPRVAPHVDEEFAAKLLRQFGSNVRRIERYLYDELQHCIQEKRIWPPAI